MTNKFIHSIELEGVVYDRTSPRVYTHVVVGRRDIARVKREANTISATDRKNAAWFAGLVTGTHNCALRVESDGRTTQKRYQDDGWTADIAANLTRIVEQRLKSMETWASSGSLQVLQWSMTEKSAVSGMRAVANRGYHTDLAVLPVPSRVPATKRQQGVA